MTGFLLEIGQRTIRPGFRFLLICLIYALCLPRVKADSIDESLLEKFRPTVVSIKVLPAVLNEEELSANPAERILSLMRSPSAFPRSEIRGTGIIISSEGLILTASSLFNSAGEVVVRDSSGSLYKGELVGKDERVGVALLKVKAAGLKSARLVAVADLVPGDQVMAFGITGGARDYSFEMSEGVISSIELSSTQFGMYLRTTVPLKAGMGGGPLVRQKDGAIVAINTMEYVRPKEPALAVSKPIDEYLEVDNELRKFGRVRRAFVGLILAPDSAGVSRSTCNTDGMGVLVTGTMHDSPARTAGVLAGDVVVTIADVKVSSPAMLAYAMRGVRPGMKVQLDVCRKDTKVVMMVEAAAMQSR